MASVVCDISISLITRLHRIDWNLVFNKCGENRNKSAKLIATIEGLIWQIDFRKSHTRTNLLEKKMKFSLFWKKFDYWFFFSFFLRRRMVIEKHYQKKEMSHRRARSLPCCPHNFFSEKTAKKIHHLSTVGKTVVTWLLFSSSIYFFN